MSPTTLTGSLHPSNRDAIAWNELGIIAFGCHSTLAFFDVRRLEIFQTLEQHATAINMVTWKSVDDLVQRRKPADPRELRCASSDISGNIIVWDVLAGEILASLRHSNTSVTDMKWLCWPDSGRDLLFSMHSTNTFVLWNIEKKERQWEYKFGIPVFRFSTDPFDPSRIAFASLGASILLVHDLSIAHGPANEQSVNLLQIDTKTVAINANIGGKGGESAVIQIRYHPAREHLLFVLFPNEICLVETQHRQVIYSAAIDAGSPLAQILPCARRDALFLVHQSGLISFRSAQYRISDTRMSASLEYGRRCFAEPHRQSVRVRLIGAALCPVSQSSIAILMSSGRIVIYQLEKSDQHLEPYRLRGIEEMLSDAATREQPTKADNNVDETKTRNSFHPHLRLSQYGIYNPLGPSVTVVRMRPMMDTADLVPPASLQNNVSSPPRTALDRIGHLAAIGTSTGVIHLVDVFSGRIERDLQVHSCPVKCLEWSGPNAIVSAAYLASLSAASSTVRNDIFITEVHTGAKRRIRPEHEESPIEMLRISHYHCYLAISFRNEPLEIWDLKTLRLLRRMSKRCPIIVDMAWSGKHHQVKAVNERGAKIHRENLVVLDNDNHLYHVVVKGLHVRDGKEVSTQWKSGAAFLRCMVWKDDVLAFGDSAGRVGIWDLARSQCRQSGLSQSTRGPVQRIVFSRLAGDYTLAAQHPTSVVVWDTEKLQAVFSLQRAGLSIIDIDMCGLTPVYIASDGMFRFALSDNEKGRNISMTDADTPLLLQHTYRNSLFNLFNESEDSNQSNGDVELEVDPDMAHLLKRLAECNSQLSRCAVIYQFAGDLTACDFCRILDARRANDEIHGELPSNLMFFWPQEAYRKRVECLTRVLLSTSRTERQLEQAIEKCVIMRKNDLAMFYLLNNGQSADTRSREDVRLNAFRACTLSANYDSEESRCLVKLTATNLIAANFVSEGIQLLSLIDQALDACKYLISQGLWHRALSYAKMSSQCEFKEVFVRYADHLANGRKSLALLVFAHLGLWERCKSLIAASEAANLEALEYAVDIAAGY